ncbi:MAG: hypothetical protein B1H03_06380 [Planctomycetales bacterium 4484_113]|nr:MAG: hypothetical protein B1H03_06380 [Planctomycetales bacterium 4484_113]
MDARRYVPLIVIVLIAVFLAAVYLPGYLRLFTFKRALGDFVHLVRMGKVIKAADYVVDGERAQVLALIRDYVPAGVEQHIQALRVHRITRDKDEFVVILAVRAEGPDFRFAGKARMRWRRVNGKWQFPFSHIDIAELLSENWQSLSYLLEEEDG